MRLEINDRRMRYAKIYLNGERRRFVIVADEEKGYIDRYRIGDRGQLEYVDGRLQTVREWGTVYITFEE